MPHPRWPHILDSQFGGTIRDTWSQLRGSASTLMDTAGRGSQDVGGWVEE